MTEKLRIKIERTEILTADKNRNHSPVKVTVSLGVASVLPEIESVHALLGQADKALYHAKQRGRNRTVCCADIQTSENC